ncbi:TetR/AcrR family transcriptional regulator [Tumebacillus sp. ITR2]|uniref:TetR/AcrR family transcriptional regulator n=1 Tax=Tumebacillus amylolyticus TaxID=2801339 RepID=A0ABS1J7A7_9BACL|nr:TetR family transcriptional regulator [Tumebacillus amylolyticus]MBL0386172.1 TetR/AcrR family transcriptional regulator [Tumebacillus amylolyticus]
MSEDVKARILAAAKHLFAQKGFKATSIRQICDEAGANVALVSYHFGGKEKLLEAVFDNFFPDGVEYAPMEEMESPVDRLKFLIEQFLTLMRRDPEVTKMIMMEINVGSERLKSILSHTLSFWKRIRDEIQSGVEQGELDVQSIDQALAQVMGVLIHPLHAGGFEPLMESWPPDLEVEIAERTRFILRGLGVRTEDSK